MKFMISTVTVFTLYGFLACAAEDSVVIIRKVDANYSENESTLTELLRTSGEINISPVLGDTLSGLISNYYKVSPTKSPAAYKQFEQYVVSKNNLRDANTFSSSKPLVLPDLPPNFSTNTSPYTSSKITSSKSTTIFSNRLKPKLQFDGRELFDMDFANVPVGNTGKVFQYRVASIDQAFEAYQFDNSISVSGNVLKISIDTASEAPPADSAILSDREIGILKDKLSKPPIRQPVLFILDDGWPDDAEAVRSREFFVREIAGLREKDKMPASNFSRQFLDLSSAKYASTNTPTVNSHAGNIKKSLKELQSLDLLQSKVKVIYVPLFRSQVGAGELLRSLIEMREMRRLKEDNFEDPVDDKTTRAAKARAETLVKQISDSPSSSVRDTTNDVIESVFDFARRYAKEHRQPFIINMSWTFPNSKFVVAVENDAYGFYVVASGNSGPDNGDTVYKFKTQFAARSAHPADMVAVMNVGADGSPACKSNDLLPEYLVLSFPGSLDDGTCGSSYSAPRVAWLIAAREAMKSGNNEGFVWIRGLIDELKAMRDPSAKDFNKIRFNIESFFSSAN